MSYVTNADIEERLGSSTFVQLTDDDGNGVADTGVVDEARMAAQGEVDSYFSRRYAVPIDLTQFPELAGLIQSVVLDLVEYRLRMRRPPISQTATTQRSHAIDWLNRVAEGVVNLPADGVLPADSTHGLRIASTGAERILTRDELAGH